MKKYASSYDTVILEVQEIEESSNGSATDIGQNDLFRGPSELSIISLTDLLKLVKGDAVRYIPKASLSNEDAKKYPTGSRVTYGKDIALFEDDFPRYVF